MLKWGEMDAGLVEGAVELGRQPYRAVVVNDLELADVAWTHKRRQ